MSFNINNKILFNAVIQPKYPALYVSVPVLILLITLPRGLAGYIGESIFDYKQSFTPLLKVLYQNVIMFGSVIITLFLWVKYNEKRKIKETGWFIKKSFLKKYLKGFLAGIFVMSLIVSGMVISGKLGSLRTTELQNLPAVLLPVIIILTGWIVQGAAEEILFRGWFLQITAARYGLILSVLVSSLLFALLHAGNNGADWLAIVNLFIFGLTASFIVINEGSVWGACGWHAAWNWSMGNIFGLNISGIPPETGSLLQVNFIGPAYFTGGDFGPEATLITSVVLLGFLFFQIKIYLKNEPEN